MRTAAHLPQNSQQHSHTPTGAPLAPAHHDIHAKASEAFHLEMGHVFSWAARAAAADSLYGMRGVC